MCKVTKKTAPIIKQMQFNIYTTMKVYRFAIFLTTVLPLAVIRTV